MSSSLAKGDDTLLFSFTRQDDTLLFSFTREEKRIVTLGSQENRSVLSPLAHKRIEAYCHPWLAKMGKCMLLLTSFMKWLVNQFTNTTTLLDKMSKSPKQAWNIFVFVIFTETTNIYDFQKFPYVFQIFLLFLSPLVFLSNIFFV